jgi:hypothetical protein
MIERNIAYRLLHPKTFSGYTRKDWSDSFFDYALALLYATDTVQKEKSELKLSVAFSPRQEPARKRGRCKSQLERGTRFKWVIEKTEGQVGKVHPPYVVGNHSQRNVNEETPMYPRILWKEHPVNEWHGLFTIFVL